MPVNCREDKTVGHPIGVHSQPLAGIDIQPHKGPALHFLGLGHLLLYLKYLLPTKVIHILHQTWFRQHLSRETTLFTL